MSVGDPTSSPSPARRRRMKMYLYCYLVLAAFFVPAAQAQLVRYDPDYLQPRSVESPPDDNPPPPPIIVASDAARRLSAAESDLDPQTKERLRRQESRADGFHFDQSFNQNKAATVSRLGILLSEDSCRLSPSPVAAPDATYFIVECPHDVSRVTLQFLSGHPFKEALTAHGRSPQRKLHFILEPTGRLVSEFIQACQDGRDLKSCQPVQIDARRLPNQIPVASRFVPMYSAEPVLEFNPKQSEHRIVVFENEPIALMVEATLDALVDDRRLDRFKENGFVNQTHQISLRPRANDGEGAVFYLSDREHAIANNLTIVTDTIPSSSPLLYDLRSSTGRLDPSFSPHQFAYFLRVHEYAQAVKFRLTAVDDKNTLCSYIDQSDQEAKVFEGHGSTSFMPLGRLPDLHTFVFDCVHPSRPENHVRYIVQTVKQVGGSTLLQSLDVMGAGLQQPFKPHFKGPYTVNMLNSDVPDLSWVSFIAIPENKKAQVSVEGVPCDRNTGHSPYFRVHLGETRKFRIYVRTKENDIAETYEVIVSRPGFAIGPIKKIGDVLGYLSTAVSSVRAYTFLHNAKFLQWISMTNRINGLPETYDIWSSLFHKWNLQWSWPPIVTFVGFQTGREHLIKQPVIIPGDPQDPTHPDSYVAPPQKYGIVAASVTDLPLALEWSNNLRDWVVSLPASASIATSLQQLRDHDAALVKASGLLSQASDRWLNMTTSVIDNLDFLSCKPADDCSEVKKLKEELERQDEKGRQTRRLLALSEADRAALISHLEVAYKNSQKVLDFTNSLTFTTISLVVIAAIYIVMWYTWLHAPNDLGSVRQDFPRILHPARFWLFVVDYALISYTQACCGLIFTPLKDAPISIFGVETTPGALGTFCAVMLVALPVTYVALGCGMLAHHSGTLVYAKVFQRYSDPRIGSYRAFWRPLPWLPILGRLFDIEISRVIEGHATDGEGEPLHALEQERRTDAPWIQPDNQRVFPGYGPEEPLLKSSVPTEVKYYKDLDAVKIGAPPYVNMGRNASVVAKFPEAFLNFCKQPVRNAYNQQLDVLCRVQLKHWAHIVMTRDNPVVIFPRDHLEMVYADALNTLVAKSQMSNLYYWALDRISSLTLIFLMALWQDASGVKTMGLFAGVSAVLAILYLPSVFSTSISGWYRQMEADYRLEVKMVKYRQKDEEKFSVWPFKDEAARDQFERMRENRQRMKTAHLFHAIYDWIFTTVDAIRYSDFWKTRLSFAIGAFLTGPVMTELCKFAVILHLALGTNMTLIAVAGRNSSSLASIAIIALALLCLNWEALKLTNLQIMREFTYEAYLFIRRVMIYAVDMAKDPRAFGDRMTFYGTQLLAYMSHSSGTVSFLYNGFQAETVRDFTCSEVAVINNELGVHMFGDVRLTDATKRQMFEEDDPLSLPRYTMQKTLVTSGTIAVHRPELDRAMPIVMPLTQFNYSRHPNDARVAATIQIVNHNTLRYVPKIRHDWQDDSFLTLYTDPKLVPPPGKIRKGLPGHGYVVKVDKVDQIITIRGPGILAGKTYNIKLKNKQIEIDDRYNFEEASQASSNHLSGRKEAECLCVNPGRLVVDVPPGYAPDLQEEMKIFPPDGREETHDPARHKVVWDPYTRKMIIRTQHALLAGDQKYVVVWNAKPRGVPVEATTTHPSSVRGELQLQPSENDEICDLSSSAWLVIRDTDKTMTIDIDLRETNAYEMLLTNIELPGSSGYLTSKVGAVLGEVDTIFGQQLYSERVFERIPCTLVQCVDPVARKWRVEPDFDEAIYRISARKEELIAISEQLRRQFDSLSDLWYRVISPAEFVNFWRDHGINVLDKDCNFVDPIRSPQDPRVRPYNHIVHNCEAALQQLVSTRVTQQLQVLTAMQNEYKIWASAYKSLHLYTAQLNLDEALQNPNATAQDRAELVARVKHYKRQFEQALPNFIYPMVVQEKLITRQSKWETQFLRWEEQIMNWLLNEEGAARENGTFGELSCYEHSLYQIMRALQFTAYKPENLLRGRTQTALHYVTSSRSVRGMNITWRPDPLGSCIAMMRVWGQDSDGRPSFHLSRWETCFLKLTTLGIKIMFTYTAPDQTEPNPSMPWNSVEGFFIPLRCFEAILCMEDKSPLSEDECVYDFAESMTGRLVFRRNTDAAVVHDNYVLRITDRAFENSYPGQHGERHFIQLGFTSDANDSDNFLPRELWYEQQQAHDKLYTFPLTFRLWPHDLRRWESVIKACRMDKPPRDNADFNGFAPGNEPPTPVPTEPVTREEPPQFETTQRDQSISLESQVSKEQLPSSDGTNSVDADAVDFEHHRRDSFSSSAPSYKSEPKSIHEQKPTPPPPAAPVEPYEGKEFLGEYQDWRFHGVATLFDRNGNEVYDGSLHESQRNGHGTLTFFKGRTQWRYEGNFVHDEPCGTGSLTLLDPQEIERLRASKDESNKTKIVGFSGNFDKPLHLTRNDTLPAAAVPTADMVQIQKFFDSDRPANLLADSDQTERSPNPTRAEKPTEDGKLAPWNFREVRPAWDLRRSMSVCGHEAVMDVSIGALNESFFYGRALKDRSDMTAEDHAQPIGDGRVGRDEFLPHTGQWARCIEPSLGYSDIGARMGYGEVIFADGTRFYKHDNRGLSNNRPNGLGHFYCPHCPLNYYGEFRNGRPEGYGCMEWGTGDKRVTYWGNFRDGKRHGEGTMVAKDDKIFVEGHFENDKMSGGNVRIDVHPDLKSKVNFQWIDAEFKNGLPDGRGVVNFFSGGKGGKTETGFTYRGEFKDGVRSGRGVIYDTEDQPVLKCEWLNDKATGRADAYYMPTGHVYIGPMKSGDRVGVGKLFESIAGGLIYDGMWDNSLPHGRGTLHCPEGKYEGEFKGGKRHGKGQITLVDSSGSIGQRVYEGSWAEDKPHGIGMYTYSEDEPPIVVEFEDGRVKTKSVKSYRQGGPCGTVPQIPEISVHHMAALEDKHPDFADKCNQLDPKHFTIIQEWSGDLWAQHEAHPFVYTSVKDTMPERPRQREFAIPRAPKPQKEDSDFVYRLMIKQAKGLQKRGLRNPRASVRVGLLHHDVSTKSDDVNGCDPIWNQTFILPFVRTQVIKFTVCDNHMGITTAEATRESNKPLGYGVFHLVPWLESMTPNDHEIDLELKDEKKGGTTQVGRLSFRLEKVPLTPDMTVHRDQYDQAALRHHKFMPDEHKNVMLSVPPPS